MEERIVEVRICERTYRIKTTNDSKYTRALAQQLNEKILQIFSSDESATLIDAAILSGLEILDEAAKDNANVQRARERAKEYAQELTKQMKETRRVQEENQHLLEENKRLRADIEMLRLKERTNTK